MTANIPLVPGWNLVSLPVHPANTAPGQVLAPIAGQYDLVFAYAGCDRADPWKKYDPAAPAFTNDLTAIDETLGLWLRATTTTTLTVSGTRLPSVSMPLCPDWNLRGYPAAQPAPPATALAGIAGCYTEVWGYDAADTADPWEKYKPTDPRLHQRPDRDATRSRLLAQGHPTLHLERHQPITVDCFKRPETEFLKQTRFLVPDVGLRVLPTSPPRSPADAEE